jgi:nitrite reductase/ring-hydroxylating ferredoxin subunit
MGGCANESSEETSSASAAVYPRRQFLALTSGCLLCGAAGVVPARAATDRPIEVGTMADYPVDVISERHIQYDLFVIRHQGKLFACTAVCPHKTSFLLLNPKDASEIICSSHDWRFTAEGLPANSRARRHLVRYGISVKENDRIWVDTSRQFQPAQWDDAACFIAIK